MIGRETMTSSSSFIDLVVLDSIREHFVSGAILTVTTSELDQIIWANAAGAQTFGNTTLVNVAGADTVFSRAQQRQILNGLRSGKASLVRVGAGLISISAQPISIDGTEAVLLSAPQSTRHHNEADQAFGMIDGLEEVNSRAAILNRDADIVVATKSFDDLNISTQTLSDLIAEVSTEDDRLVKRPITSQFGEVPSAIAYLDDNRFMLMAIVAEDAEVQTQPSEDIAEAEVAVAPVASLAQVAPSDEVDEVTEIADGPEADIEHVERHEDEVTDESVVSMGIAPVDNVTPTAPKEMPQQVQRFVWKTDREDAIVDVSDSFSELVGKADDALIGEEFQSILAQHGVDRAPIDTLMVRQDTWSGVDIMLYDPERSMSALVTLSALPQRDADNQFDGYRGFGLIRYQEAAEFTANDLDDAEPVSALAQELVDDAPEIAIENEEVAENLSLFDHQDITEDEASEDDHSRDPIDDSVENTIEEEIGVDEASNTEEHAGDLSDKERAAFSAIREQLTSSAPGALAARSTDSSSDNASSSEADQEESNVVTLTPKPVELKKPDNRTENDDIYPRFIPSAFAAIDLLPRQGNIELVALDQLPLAIMLQRGDDIIYANEQLLNLTGFDDISDIANAGGLNALFEEPETNAHTDSLNEARAVMRLKTDKNDGLDAEAHIQVVNFEDTKALLLALVPLSDEVASTPTTDLENTSALLASPVAPTLDMSASNDEIAGLKSQIEELHGILDTATDGVILLDGVANIRSLNHSAEALFGYETDAIRGRPFTTLFAIESHRGAMEYLTALTDNGVASVLNDGLEVIGREQEGRFIPLFMTLGRLAGSNGYCAVLRDITQWKRAEENLNLARQDAETASTQKTAFLARMSHEIRTPLNAIIGFSDLMLDDRFSKVQDERSREYLKDINKSGGLVLELVNDLLDLTKIESGEQEMEFSAVSINELLRESVSMMQPRANQQRVIIRSSLNADLPDVVADARSIKQIALNLLSNAIRFTKAGGQVIASSAILDDGCVAIRIRDTGIGMTEDEIEHAMQPYKQVKNEDVIATKEGSGLGLPLTKAMVEGNRAEMSITSTPDVGTIVEVIFPSNRVLSE